MTCMAGADRRSATIDRLLNGTLRMLEEVGYARFRPADVGLRCGLSNGLVFKYFPTKLDLVATALERALREHFARLVTSAEALPAAQITRRGLLTMMWEVLGHPELRWTYELFAASAHNPVLHGKLRGVITSHGAIIDEFAEEYVRVTGLADPADARRIVNLITWAMQGLVLNDMARGPSGREEELIDLFVRIGDALYGEYVPRNDAAPSGHVRESRPPFIRRPVASR